MRARLRIRKQQVAPKWWGSEVVLREKRPGVRLWGQGELSQGQPAVLAIITSSELTDGRRRLDGVCLHAWQPSKGQGIIGLRPAIMEMKIVTASARALVRHGLTHAQHGPRRGETAGIRLAISPRKLPLPSIP